MTARGESVIWPVDPHDVVGARSRSQEPVAHLQELGIDEVCCHLDAAQTNAGRKEGIRAFTEWLTS